jgi:hypothetical protein
MGGGRGGESEAFRFGFLVGGGPAGPADGAGVLAADEYSWRAGGGGGGAFLPFCPWEGLGGIGGGWEAEIWVTVLRVAE